MNETTESNVSTEAEVSAFDSGWDDFDAAPTYEPAEESVETETEETSAEATETEDATDGADQTTEQKEETAAEETKPSEAEDTFELKYMGNLERVGRNEVIALAQKGKDYDRIHGKLDELTPEFERLKGLEADYNKYSSFLDKLAKQSNTDIQGLIDSVEAKVMANEKGISEEIALERVKLNRERAEFEAQKIAKAEHADKEQPTAEPQKTVEQAKRQDEFIAFAAEYPDVKPDSIPKEVWDEFNKGKSLIGAYSRYENKQLKEKLTALEQNTKNRERSTGSRDSAGTGKQKDAFDLGWDSF